MIYGGYSYADQRRNAGLTGRNNCTNDWQQMETANYA